MMRAGLLMLGICVAGCGSALVGAECLSGYDECEGQCVDLSRDLEHCGACGVICTGLCEQSMCIGGQSFIDAGSDSGNGDGDGGDGDGDINGDGDVTMGDPPMVGRGMMLSPDAGLPGTSCAAGKRLCDDECVVLSTDPNNCGSCGNECGADEYCTRGVCDADCADGELKCGVKSCVDPNSKYHCGECDKVCNSGICVNEECADALPGHIVVLGHDFVDANLFQRTLLGTAVFLGQGNPVRTLVYEGAAMDEAILGVTRAIDFVENTIGRASVETVTNADDVTTKLDQADVFLIHAQAGATDGELDMLGVQWGQAMVDFVRRGGVIVGLDGPSELNTGSFHILEPAALFLAEERETVTGGEIIVYDSGKGLALYVGGNYAVEENTVQFLGVASGGDPITGSPSGEAVIVDRVVRP